MIFVAVVVIFVAEVVIFVADIVIFVAVVIFVGISGVVFFDGDVCIVIFVCASRQLHELSPFYIVCGYFGAWRSSVSVMQHLNRARRLWLELARASPLP